MYDTLSNKILKKLKRQVLSSQDTAFIVEWKESRKLKDDIILEAVNRAAHNNVYSFKYIDAILNNWEKNGVKTYTDILELDKKFKPKQKNNGFKVKIKRYTKTAKMPTYGDDMAAGADLYADIDKEIYIPNGTTTMIPTGISFEIPEGYAGLMIASSELSCKNGLAPANKIINCDFKEPIMVGLHNHEDYTDTINSDYTDYKKRHTIKPGDRIAQIVFMPYKQAYFEEIDELKETEK